MTTEEAQKLLDAYCIAQQDRHCCGDEMQPALNVARDACLKAMLPQDVGVLLQRIEDLELKADMAGYESAVYLRGQDSGVHGVAERWRQALEAPIPNPGVMSEPLEGLYRRTEALRTALREIAEEGEYSASGMTPVEFAKMARVALGYQSLSKTPDPRTQS